jgi:predicted TIM-barrel fold metal-dependent hydrolase
MDEHVARIFDADNHYWETSDAFTRHRDPKFADRGVLVQNVDGHTRYLVGGKLHPIIPGPGDVTLRPRPGSLFDYFAGKSTKADLAEMLACETPSDHPEWFDRDARLRCMDEQGVEACWMFPSQGVCMEGPMQPDLEASVDIFRAFNRWLEEDWGYGADGRICGAPLVPLDDRGEALAGRDRRGVRGARFVVVTCGPIDGRSPGDPHFDPFWARLQETGTILVYHIGRTPFSEIYNAPWGLRPHPPSHRHSLMEYYLSFTERPITDTLTALVADNVFGRFPELRVWSVEYGSSWVAPLVRKLDHIARLFSKDMWRFGAPPAKPSDTLRRHLFVSPFFEDDVVGLCRTLGVSQVLAGSDYPHPEGLANPAEFADELTALSPADRRLVLRDNMGSQLGV